MALKIGIFFDMFWTIYKNIEEPDFLGFLSSISSSEYFKIFSYFVEGIVNFLCYL